MSVNWKLFGSSIIVVVFSTNANAQVSFGVNAGAHIVNLNNEDNYQERWETGAGYRIGGNVERMENKAGIGIGVYYSVATVSSIRNDDRIKLYYVSIPVSFIYQPIKKLKIPAGIELNFLTNQIGPERMPLTGEYFEDLEYGIFLGVEYFAHEQFAIQIRNYFGVNYNTSLPTQFIYSKDANRLNILTASLSYYFKKLTISKKA